PLQLAELPVENPGGCHRHPLLKDRRRKNRRPDAGCVHVAQLLVDLAQVRRIDGQMAGVSFVNVNAIAVGLDRESGRQKRLQIVDDRTRQKVVVCVDDRRQHRGAFPTAQDVLLCCANPARVGSTAASRYFVLGILTLTQTGTSLIAQSVGALAPFLAVALALDRTHIGMLPAGIAITWAAFGMFSGVIVDRFGERRMIFLSGLGMGLAICISAAVENYWWVLGWFAVYGIMSSFSTPAGGRDHVV